MYSVLERYFGKELTEAATTRQNNPTQPPGTVTAVNADGTPVSSVATQQTPPPAVTTPGA
jgi:hypothetical protein